MDAPDTIEALRLYVRQLELQERRSKRAEGFKLPSRVYELLNDLGRIDSAIAVLRTLWHKDNDDYRKSMLHLSKLSWDLRKQLQEYL